MSDAQKDDLQQFLNELEGEETTAKKGKPDLKVVEGGADMEQTLEGLKGEVPPDSLLDQELEKEIDQAMDTLKPSYSGPDTVSASEGTLTMSLQGNMTLKLTYSQGTQNVSLRFERDVLHVNLDNGTEFKIPVK